MTAPDIINNPNHPLYGPARRLFVILSGITGDIDDLRLAYFREWGATPYIDLAFQINHGVEEAPALREIIGRVFVAIDCR